MKDSVKEKFIHLACLLSPENLTCDGELSDRKVAQKRKLLMKEWADLERQLGRTVTETEAWSWCK
jgi:hypothetical protein